LAERGGELSLEGGTIPIVVYFIKRGGSLISQGKGVKISVRKKVLDILRGEAGVVGRKC